MTGEIISIVLQVLKFVLTRVNASNDTLAAYEKLVESSINDGLVSKQTNAVFNDQRQAIEDEINAKNKSGTLPAPKSK